MRLLVIGGTRFLGRHLVEAALARGDSVTLFNRGRSVAQPPAGVDWLQGDRAGDLAALASGPGWDAAIDTCGYLPADTGRLARALAGRVGRLAFISSVSAYASMARPNAEDAPLGTIDDPDTTTIDGRTYGPLKALCEAAVQQAFGLQRCLLVRPGLIVGPHDPTGRFTWWPARLARAAADGQPVLAPGMPDRPLQVIDARDLAAWLLQALDHGAAGAFNAVSPPGAITWGGLLQACAAAARVLPDLRWVPDDQLLAHGVGPWMELPLWIPASGPDAADSAAFMAVPSGRAQAAGLRCRSIGETVADTLAWWQALPAAQQVFAATGLAPEREAAVLAGMRPV
ncbi:SDR family oxidoreductase [Pseudaquabacterium pictum]|uniref:Reductase n=1 Tax=Pseudaquabacterium pictum TaxID=2315236 RepID=A0A480AYL1_9BURK|nr:SDR family oxidoreductase [Rubrivivax pictus]GCL66016.1 reductase [Rubrivivax pictus]